MAPGANIALVVTPNAETEGVQGVQNLHNAQRWALAPDAPGSFRC